MITKQELLEFSTQFSLRSDVVEKDYALGWLLTGIGRHPLIGENWIFKGGTCLKKCYFETYRFSEDLDFTILQPDHLNKEFLERVFKEITDGIYEQTGLELPAENRVFEVYETRGKPAGQGRIGYRGPTAPRGDLPRIKLDLTNDECLVAPSVRRKIHLRYSDSVDAAEVTCYGYEEIFAEKIRALSERLRPRDLYDVIHMYRHEDLRPQPASVRRILEEKCKYKNIGFPALADLSREPRRTELENEWKNMLGHQLPILPPFQQFWDELPEVFAWLLEERVPVALPAIPEIAGERGEIARTVPQQPRTIPRFPPTAPQPVRQFTGFANPLEVIRFAGATRLCLSLGYEGTMRLIEPYALRTTKAGKLILRAVRIDKGEDRTYSVDKIEGAELTQIPFTPRYAVELTATGPLYAPPHGKGGSSPSKAPRRTPKTVRSTGFGAHEQKYAFRCSVCNRKFSRKKYDATLNEHKDKNGNPCFGRWGVYEGTEWG